MSIGEIAECECKPVEAAPSAVMLAGQGACCAICDQAAHTLYRDGDRDTALCHSCFLVIRHARDRRQTPELTVGWLRTVARYLATTEGP